MSAWLLIPAAYVLGWFMFSVGAARYWYRSLGSQGGDRWEGAAWGMFGSVIWPVFAVFLLPAYLVSAIARRIA